MIKTVIGIDPGLHGAAAVITGGIPGIYDTPTLKAENGFQKKKKNGKRVKKYKNVYSVPAMVRILSPYKDCAHVFLEKIHAMPGQGTASMFTMGEGYGLWQGIITALGMPLTLVTPQTWKKAMMEGMTKGKDASILRAGQLYPDLVEVFAKHHDRAESLLIAEYGRRELGL